ncbi:MAG: Crp/Fnr family transcriptional regulator [Cyanobacteria bacterium P01_C01_bin.72]
MIFDTLEQDSHQDYLEYFTFNSGELITLQADYYWLLQRGIVKTSTWTETGTPITLGYWSVNDLIGQPLFLLSPYRVECLTEVTAGRIPMAKTNRIINFVQHQIRQTEEVLYILHSDKIYQRLRQILLWLSGKFGQETRHGKLIQLRLTHQDLAELVGATRVTVTKTINQLEQEGFLSRPQRNTIVISQSSQTD